MPSEHAPRRIATPVWKFFWTLLVVGGLYSLYLASNHHPIREPRLLPMLWVDDVIPMLPWTVWPYLLLSYFAVAPLFLRDEETVLRCLSALLFGYSLNLAVFFAFPTTFPRTFSPEMAGHARLGFEFLYGLDSPGNCFPSGHITAPFIMFWALAADFPKARVWLWTLFIVLCPTILTTKQHYFIDLPGGLLTGALGILLANRYPILLRFLPRQR